MTTALLVVDMQVSLIEDETPNPDEILAAVTGLVEAARGEGVPVVWITDSRVEPNPALHPSCTPTEDEVQVVKHQRNAFEGTDLEAELTILGAERVIICGMQSDACIHATTRAAAALGFQVVLVADAGLGTVNAVLSSLAPFGDLAVEVILNRFDPGDDLHRRNRDWLVDRCGLTVRLNPDELADQLSARLDRRS